MNERDPPVIVHQLPEYERDGYPPSYEYPLPAQIEPSSLAALHPWLREAAALRSPEAHAFLQARWNGLRDSALRPLRDQILECEVTSIVLTGPEAWLLCVHENGGFNLIAPPVDRDAVKKQQVQCGMGNNPLLTDLVEHFGGLREDFAPGGGYFMVPQQWRIVNEPWMGELPGYSEWKDALMVFNSRSGDALLLHPSGRVGWWVGDEMRMRDAYEDLGACFVDFARYRAVPWPFGSYEPDLDFFLRVVG
jgi:hypothetical protein